MNYIGVFCGSSEKLNPSFYNLAYEVGAYLARDSRVVVHGGVNLGLMRSLNNGCKDNSGKSIGVLPNEFLEYKFDDAALTKYILVENMEERKMMILNLCDNYILLPGGFGSLDELFFILTQSQISTNWKNIFILNYLGYYSPLKKLLFNMSDSKFCSNSDLSKVHFINKIEAIKKYF